MEHLNVEPLDLNVDRISSLLQSNPEVFHSSLPSIPLANQFGYQMLDSLKVLHSEICQFGLGFFNEVTVMSPDLNSNKLEIQVAE